ncbi:hypothetical protein [Curtobacterium oceanosedimentum]|uniref:hypothetical protein n=1 Tax=Curtobacterium oceanosedimentum TaxID=465820 RepID=UPI00339A1146
MTDAGDPHGRQQDRGYYGAGWSQPAPPAAGPSGGQAWSGQPAPGQPGAQAWSGQPGAQAPGQPWPGQPGGQPWPGQQPQYGQQQPHGERGRARASRTSDPRRAFAPGASVANTTGALIAVVSIVLVEVVSGVFGLLGTSLVVHPFSTSGTGASLLGSFVSGVFASPFPFYAGAFTALAFLTPIARRSPLPTVLLRAVLAGAAGTVALALVGVFTGSYAAVRTGSGVRLVIDVLTGPLQNGIPFTLMLLATSTVAWLWLGRPRGGRAAQGAAGGRLGAVRPADAVPPSTVQPAPQPHGAQQQQQQQQPYGQRPDDRWTPPTR